MSSCELSSSSGIDDSRDDLEMLESIIKSEPAKITMGLVPTPSLEQVAAYHEKLRAIELAQIAAKIHSGELIFD